MTRYTFHETPIGHLTLAENDAGLASIRFEEAAKQRPPESDWRFVDRLELDAAAQLDAYFSRELTTFDLPLAPMGSRFQLAVWRAVGRIPYGETRSYLDIANELGQPGSVRSVGAANGANPLPIVVPCHRVLGSDGSLTGYAGGLELKRRLLELEQPHKFGLGPLFADRA
ncbi:MAG: methylated-DNA--[protein]-cysteine S-methyltransferase [Trueperaceae bacterium]